ncbi:MAG: hypothetical protein ACOYK8_01380 [Alphaproteobacteria bacterium]
MPQFDPAHFLSQIFWLILVFGVFFRLMTRRALPVVNAVLKNRSAIIAADLASAEQDNQQAEMLAASYQQRLTVMHAEFQQEFQQVIKQVEADITQRKLQLEKKIEAQLQATRSAVNQARESALQEIETHAVDVTAAILKQLTGQQVTEEKLRLAVGSSLREWQAGWKEAA